MINIKKIINVLSDNFKLKSNLELLVNYCIKNHTLIIDFSVVDFDAEILENEEIIKIVSGKYSVGNNPLFSYAFYEKQKEILDFQVNQDFNRTSNFLNKIKEVFYAGKYKNGFPRIERELWAMAIIETNKSFDVDFVEYIKTLIQEDDDVKIIAFYEGYSRALSDLQIDVKPFYKNILTLLIFTETNTYNNSTLLEGIRDKAFQNEEFGIYCFEYSLKLDIIENNFLIPIIAGLYDKIGIDFFENKISPLIGNEKLSVAIKCGLSNIRKITEKEANIFLQLYDRFNKENTEILIASPRLIFSILKSEDFQNKADYVVKCFTILGYLITIDTPDLINMILNGIKYLDGLKNEKTDLIVELIKQPHFEIEKYLKSIDEVIFNIEDIQSFNLILQSIAKFKSFQSVSKCLTLSIQHFIDQYRLEFDKVIINLLIHNQASFRILGLDIFNNITHYLNKFEFDILSLDSLKQYKLWVSILQNYREPKYVIPCLLPLLKSKSSLVRESLICKMEEYSENYGGITDVLENHLDLEDLSAKEVYDRVEKYRDDFFYKKIDIKKGIKELNPYYSQNKLFTEYTKNYSRTFNRLLQKDTMGKSGILSLFTEVKLAKGGGWKMEGNDNISKLSKISSSFSLPRSLFIDAELFEQERLYEMSENWDDNFKGIKAILENE